MAASLSFSVLDKDPVAPNTIPDGFHADDFDSVVDISEVEVAEFVKFCSPEQVQALNAFALYGPLVHGRLISPLVAHLGEFNKAINELLQSFSDERIYLFTWDHWPAHPDCVGHYALSTKTHAALRSYFRLPEQVPSPLT